MIKIKKLKKVNEVMFTGSQNGNMKSILINNIIPNINKFVYDGDIEEYKVFKSEDTDLPGIYIIKIDNDICAFFQVLDETIGTVLQLDYVEEDYRGKGLTAKFILYMKRHLGCNKIFMGEHFSKDMINVIKSLSKRFVVNWVKDDEVDEFDPDNIDNYVSLMGPTGWRIMLENTNNNYKYPRYFMENGDIIGSFYKCHLDENIKCD